MKKSISINALFLILISILCANNAYCQKKINILESSQLEQLIINDTTFQKFAGNVIVKYDDLTIICDTILIDEYKKNMTGWGNTHIFNDTLNCKSDSINLLQNKSLIKFYNNTYVKTDNITIQSNQLEYDYNHNILRYYSGGKVIKNKSIINSKLFTHNLQNNNSNFNQLVYIKNKDYEVETDNISYSGELIKFTGPTIIKNSKLTINGVNGYIENNNIIEFNTGVVVQFEDIKIESQYLKRDLNQDKSDFQHNIKIQIDEQTYIYGEKMTHLNNKFDITKDCSIELIDQKDTITITGDAIYIDDNDKKININNKVTITGEKLKGKCEFMIFESNYNNINMEKNPVLWFNQVQLTGEKITLYRVNNVLDSIYIPKKPFIISPKDSLTYYDQIKGRELEGKFENNNLKNISFHGNSEMKYFEHNFNKTNNISLNYIKSSSINLIFQNQQIKQVIFTDDIESNYIDIKPNVGSQEDLLYFKGFKLEKR